MDNKQIDPQVYENFVDASTALMLEYYSAHHQEPLSMLPENEDAFPTELDALCRKDIRTSFARHQRQKVLRSAMKVTASVICALLVTIGLVSTLILSVDAFREPIINFYTRRTDSYLEFSDKPPLKLEPVVVDPEDPLKGLLPENYFLFQSTTNIASSIIHYEGIPKGKIKFSSFPLSGISRFNTENAIKVHDFVISGHTATLIVRETDITVVWEQSNLDLLCSVAATDLSEDEVIDLVTEAMVRFDQAETILPSK